MKVDRSILMRNDQNMGDIGDPDKLENSIEHLANVIDNNANTQDSLVKDNTENKNDVASLKSRTTVLETDNSSNKERISTNENRLSSVQNQVNQLVVYGDSSIEAAQARVTATGKSFSTLQERLNESDMQLSETSSHILGVPSPIKLKKGIISFTWDNSYVDHYTKAFPEFKRRGLLFALSPISDDLATTQYNSDYYTYENLKEMIDYGAEIIAHGATGLNMNNPGLNLNEVEFELSECKRFFNKLGLKVNGYCATASILDVSYHEILKKYFDYGFTEYWSNIPNQQAVIDEKTNLYKMGRKSLNYLYTNGGVQAIKDAIDYAENSGKWLNFYNHRLDSGLYDSIPLTVLQEILDYIKMKNLDVLLPTQAVQMLNAKFIVGENFTNLGREMNARNTKVARNLLVNPQFSGSSSKLDWWTQAATITSGVATSFPDYSGFRGIKYALSAVNNIGKYIGVNRIIPLKSQKKSDVITFSVEVESDTNNANLQIGLRLDNGATVVNHLSKIQPISKGKQVYESSILLPKGNFDTLQLNCYVLPQTADAMTVELTKPKLEYSRSRTSWNDFNTDVRDYMEYKVDRTVNYPPAVNSDVLWNLKQFDDANGYNPSTGEYTAQSSGIFSVEAYIQLPIDVGARCVVQLNVNGSVYKSADHRAATGNPIGYSLATKVKLNTGDKVKISVLHTNSQNLQTTLSSVYSHVAICRV